MQPKTIEAYSRAIRRVGDYFDHQIDDLSEVDLSDNPILGEFGRGGLTRSDYEWLVAAWANFARSGNPNGKGEAAQGRARQRLERPEPGPDAPWPRWRKGADSPAYFLQDDAWKTVQTNSQFAAAHQCGFWQSILRYK